jgi:hypothetical protein
MLEQPVVLVPAAVQVGAAAGDDGLWNLLDMTDEAELDLASVGCRIALVEVLEGMASGDDAVA